MTLELLSLECLPGYAGALEAARHPELAGRYHFWRGSSGNRYACTRFIPSRLPAYENAVQLYVSRTGGDMTVLGVGTSERRHSAPYGTDEVHVHLVPGSVDELRTAVEDLSALAIPRTPAYLIECRAA